MSSELLVKRLIDLGYKVATAESCTGGLVASGIISVPDASKVLDVSVVTYSNHAKMAYANVSYETIKEYGVVSEQVAGEMAEGVAVNNKSQVGIATSGFAGPSTEETDVPVGTVCFGVYVDGYIYTCTMVFKDLDRNGVRNAAAEFAIDFANSVLSIFHIEPKVTIRYSNTNKEW